MSVCENQSFQVLQPTYSQAYVASLWGTILLAAQVVFELARRKASQVEIQKVLAVRSREIYWQPCYWTFWLLVRLVLYLI